VAPESEDESEDEPETIDAPAEDDDEHVAIHGVAWA